MGIAQQKISVAETRVAAIETELAVIGSRAGVVVVFRVPETDVDATKAEQMPPFLPREIVFKLPVIEVVGRTARRQAQTAGSSTAKADLAEANARHPYCVIAGRIEPLQPGGLDHILAMYLLAIRRHAA